MDDDIEIRGKKALANWEDWKARQDIERNGAEIESVPPPDAPRRAVDGAAFIFDALSTVPALWGQGNSVLWAQSESLMIAGPQGLCKTTLAGLLMRAQLGLGDGQVLGLPVAPIDGRILYLAMDRPRQIARSLRRQFADADREVLAERVIMWPGPLPADLAAQPTLLAGMVDHFGAKAVYLDSLKDAVIGLTKDEVAAAYNRARQYVLQTGCDLCDLHHMIKRRPDGGPPKSIEDVYGSGWLTNGCGSVILLTGDPGDPLIGLRHAKQPAEEVGPWTLTVEPDSGELNLWFKTDLLDLAKATGPDGLTAKAAAVALFDTDKPTRGQTEKARRQLNAKVADGVLVRLDGSKGRGEGSEAAWFLKD
jgi:hypothetical protein